MGLLHSPSFKNEPLPLKQEFESGRHLKVLLEGYTTLWITLYYKQFPVRDRVSDSRVIVCGFYHRQDLRTLSFSFILET